MGLLLSERAALQPLQAVEGCGYRELADDRQMLEHRAGPWLEDSPLLGTLLQVRRRACWKRRRRVAAGEGAVPGRRHAAFLYGAGLIHH